VDPALVARHVAVLRAVHAHHNAGHPALNHVPAFLEQTHRVKIGARPLVIANRNRPRARHDVDATDFTFVPRSFIGAGEGAVPRVRTVSQRWAGDGLVPLSRGDRVRRQSEEDVRLDKAAMAAAAADTSADGPRVMQMEADALATCRDWLLETLTHPFPPLTLASSVPRLPIALRPSSCQSRGKANVDHIFFAPSLNATKNTKHGLSLQSLLDVPRDEVSVRSNYVLPNELEPSDHYPMAVRWRWE
jgi:hypothetical protein